MVGVNESQVGCSCQKNLALLVLAYSNHLIEEASIYYCKREVFFRNKEKVFDVIDLYFLCVMIFHNYTLNKWPVVF